MNDDDNLVNGFINVTLGFAQTSTTTATPAVTAASSPPPSDSGSGDKKVGCTINPAAEFDPTLLALVTLSLWYLYKNRKKSNK
ncbi:MAG: hypothetical protein HQM03_21400 [Magnetococcales bacterium]|nr:hypothetical protein [Magnetococcales bacterium]